MSLTLRELFDSLYKPQRLPLGADQTIKQHYVQIKHFAKHLGREPTLDDLTDATLATFLSAHAVGRAVPTANKAYHSIVALWSFAADAGLVSVRCTMRPLKEPERLPLAWTVGELCRLLQACDKMPGLIAGIPAGNWWRALHECWWSTGERCWAMLAVEIARTDLERGEILVPAEARKGKDRDMLYRLLPSAVEAVTKIYSPTRKLLFPWPWSQSTLYNHYAKLLRIAGLPDDRKSKPHRMRRSFASHLEAAGGNATAALRHSSRRVTEKAYLDPRIVGGQNPAELLPPLTGAG